VFFSLVQLRVLLPLLRQVVQCEDRGHRAHRYAGAAIDALHRVNIELGHIVECGPTVVIGRVLLGVDAIYRAGVDAGGILRSDALGPVWPAYGVALAAILLCGHRVWVGIVVAAFLIAFLSPVPFLTAVGQAAGATLAALIGVFLQQRRAEVLV